METKHTDFHISEGEGLSFHDQDVWELQKIRELHLDGEGIKLAVLDTGFFRHHRDFKDKLPQIEVLNYVQGQDGQTLPHPTACTFPSNHCTAVVSLIFEVAPKAEVLVMRVATSEDSGRNPAYVTAALDDLLTLAVDAQKRVDIVSMSFGFSDDYGWEEKIDKLESLGTICVAAAGNRGAYQKTIPSPACFSKVISVGSLSKGGNISDFTPKSRDIQAFAQGEDLVAPCLPFYYNNSEIATFETDPSSPSVMTVDNYLVAKHCTGSVRGTSMATPIVAGLLALLFQHADQLTSTKCAKARKCSFVRSVLRDFMQDSMNSEVLRPYDFFKDKKVKLLL